MKKVFEFICEISESRKRLDIFLFEKINGSHFFPMEEKDLICSKISTFIRQND